MADKETYDDYSAELEVWALFAEDGREALDAVEETLLALESNPTDAGQIATLFRGLHTFKGNARMMGLDVLESLAHHAEDLVAVVRDEGVALTSGMIDLLLEILDHSRGMLDHVVTHRRDVEAAQVEGLVARLRDMLAEHLEQAPPFKKIPLEDVDEIVDDVDEMFILDAMEEVEEIEEIESVGDDRGVEEPVSGAPVLGAAGETEEDVLVEELVDPATDSLYVQIFMEMAEDGMERLHAALDMLVRGGEEEEAGLQEIKAVASTLRRAAGRMGYERLVAMSNELATTVEDGDGEGRVVGLERLMRALAQELAAIQGVAQPPEPEESVQPPPRRPRRDRLAEQLQVAMSEALAIEPAPADGDITYRDILDMEPSQRLEQPPQLPRPPQPLRPPQPVPGFGESGVVIADVPAATRLFRSWCKGRMLADLARLGEVMDDLEQFMRQFLVGGSALAWDEELVNEVTYLLRALYHSCVFHRLDQGARTTLALEDLYTRVAEGEMALNGALLDLTRAYVTQLGIVIEPVCVGDTPDTAPLADLLSQTEEMLHLHAESRVQQVTKDVLNLLDLPPEFREVMTPENILELSRALQAGKGLYTVLADLNREEEIGRAFYEWSRSDSVRLITSVTVFRDERTLFDFLLATPESQEAILETFAEMDPQGRYLTLERCALREGVDLEEAVSAQPVQPVSHPAKRAAETRSAVSTDTLADFLENVGEMVATRATLHRVTRRLTEVDLGDTVARLVKQSDGDWQRVGKELQAALGSWTEDLSALSHAETEMGAALDQFQETALALRARPAAEILDPLQRLVQDVARHLGKMVELDVTGADVGLDYGALDILADPLRRLVWFAVAHGIEKPVQRREAGKPMTGRVSVALRKAADHVQVVIEDDGGGIDLNAVLERARELGWTNRDSVPAGRLSEWVFRDGFGGVGDSYDVEGIDLAAINAELRAQRGWLDVSSEPGRGTRFALDIPLDMVVIDGMVMRVGGLHYVVPIEAVRRIVKPEVTQIVHSSADGGQNLLRLEEELVPVRALTGNAHAPVQSVSRQSGAVGAGLLLVVEAGEQGIALAVDELIGQQQVLIQPLQGHLAEVQGISGCALLGEGDVGVVLDLNRMNV